MPQSEVFAGEATQKKEPPRKIKVLNIQLEVKESDDVAELVAKASELGEPRSISLHTQFDYGYDELY